ncbi:MAG: N-acetylgalactosamine-6-sulfatase, partial [Planctomycetaceae bacterium]|nr:N-acetylgalactosamine-6-sulfatase [Planctomycetaceae bacterium]
DIQRADLIYTKNGGKRYEEWFRTSATITKNDTVVAKIPEGTTHFYLNVIDENQFLRSYPEVLDPKQPSKSKLKSYAQRALQPIPN